MTCYNNNDIQQMKQIASILKKNNVPYNPEHHDWAGLQLRFGWCDGDVVCHDGTFHMPESYCFPWDDGDVTRDTPEGMASRIISLYHKLQQGSSAAKKFRVEIQFNMEIEAADEQEALDFAIAEIANEEEGIYYSVEPVRDERQEWIDQHYKEAMDVVNSTECYSGDHLAHLKFCKDATIFIRHWINTDDDIGVAAPRHGDKYDRKTGIAVAYAKAMGEAVPDYI